MSNFENIINYNGVIHAFPFPDAKIEECLIEASNLADNKNTKVRLTFCDVELNINVGASFEDLRNLLEYYETGAVNHGG